MSHHYSGPNFRFPHGDGRLNLTDLYVFPKPGGTGKSILIMNVHPSSNWAQEPTTREPFATDALYELRIDTDGDCVADITYRVRFDRTASGSWTATLRRAEGAQSAQIGDIGQVIVDGAPVSLDREAQITQAGDYRFFAGWRSDPFFFDPVAAVNNLQFTGKDFFAAYLVAEPVDDARFIPAFAHSLQHAGGYAEEEARRVARTLLPDLLRFDPARPALYPNNGRALTDDVLDHFLSILTNGRVTTDGVGAHTDLLTEFPYLGPPHRSAAGTRAG